MIFILVVFISSAAIQSLFYLLMSQSFVRINSNSDQTAKERPLSVLIAARNEAENLKKLIPLLLNQQYGNFEIIIALDRCSDNSEKVIEEYLGDPKLSVIKIDKLPQSFSGKKYALNRAIEKSKNDILVFTDADCLPLSDLWLKSVNNAYQENSQIAIGYGPYKERKSSVNRFIRYETIITALQYFAFAKLGMPYMGVGRNMSYRKSFFQENHGYGQFSGIIGGDDDLFVSHHATRTNLNSYYNKESHVFSEAKDSWKSLLIQKHRHLSVGKYYQKKHQLILGLLGGSQIVFWLTFAILATLRVNPPILLLCLAIRYFSFSLFFILGTRKIGDSFTWWWIPVLDVVHTLFLLIMGPLGFFTKRVKWS